MKICLRPDIGTPLWIRVMIVLAHLIDALVRLISLAKCYTNLPFEAKALEVKYVVRMRQKQHETRKQTSVGK